MVVPEGGRDKGGLSLSTSLPWKTVQFKMWLLGVIGCLLGWTTWQLPQRSSIRQRTLGMASAKYLCCHIYGIPNCDVYQSGSDSQRLVTGHQLVSPHQFSMKSDEEETRSLSVLSEKLSSHWSMFSCYRSDLQRHKLELTLKVWYRDTLKYDKRPKIKYWGRRLCERDYTHKIFSLTSTFY